MTVYLRLDPPYQWVRTDGAEVQSFGEVGDLASYPIQDEESVVGIVSGEWVTTHRVKLPAKSRKQFNLALPYALEDSFTEDVEHIHFVCPKWRAGEESIVYSLSIQKLEEWNRLCSEHDVPATRLLPEYALLPNHDVAQCSLALVNGKVLAKRVDGGGITLEIDYIELWLKELPMDAVIAANDEDWTKELIEQFPDRDIRHWPFGDKLANWIEYGDVAEFDLWSDRFRPVSRQALFRQYRWPITLASLAIAILIGAQVFFYFTLHHEIKLITQESQVLAKRLIPELDYVEPGQERTFVERFSVEQQRGVTEFNLPRALITISPILRAERVTLKEIRYRGNELVIECLLISLGQVDSIATRLQSLPNITATLQGTNSDETGLVATFSITPDLEATNP